MIKICFLGPLARDEIQADIKNFDELKSFLNNIEDIDKQILHSSAIALNNKLIDSPASLEFKQDDVVFILPPVCGG